MVEAAACMKNWNWEIGSSKKKKHARECQEIEELRRICCEEANQARHAKKLKNCLCNNRDILRLWVRWLLKNQDLQNRVNSLTDTREFYDPESGSSSGATQVLDSTPTNSEFQDIASLRFWIAAKYTELYGYYGNRFDLLNKDDPLQSTATQRIWHHPLKNWGLTQLGQQECRKENRWTRRFNHLTSKADVKC